MNKRTYVIASLAALVGCAVHQANIYQIDEPLDTATAERLIGSGTGTVKGSALIRQQGGGVVTCAGISISLIPVTSYATERMRAIYGNVEKGYNPAGLGGRRPQFSPDLPDYQRLTREARCDTQGFFKFENVAEGNFYVVTSITWKVSQYFPEGGALMQLVRVTPGGTVEMVLTP